MTRKLTMYTNGIGRVISDGKGHMRGLLVLLSLTFGLKPEVGHFTALSRILSAKNEQTPPNIVSDVGDSYWIYYNNYHLG